MPAGTARAAAYIDGTYLLVVGTNQELYIEKVGVTGFVPAGGATTAIPALTAILVRLPGLPAAPTTPATTTGSVQFTGMALDGRPD